MTPISFSEAWAAMVREHRDEFFVGTEAHHGLGDISREADWSWKDRIFRIDSTHSTPDDHIGAWLTGFGFIEVRFPKATARPLTDDEIEWLAENPVAIA